MKANPGGTIAPSDVIGRDRLILNLWRILNRQSVVLTAERRMGKTSIIKKMQAEAPEDKRTIYRDLEGVSSPLEFAEAVYRDAETYLSGRQKAARRMKETLQALGGTEFPGGVKFPAQAASHWKEILTAAVGDLADHQDQQVIFFWDELPWMLKKIKDRTDEQAAMEVLDTLRALRQTYPTLRMVFTGSIGLHNVLTSLKEAGYVNAPINDMYTVDVPPLAGPDAIDLARRLIAGEALETSQPDALAESVANAVDGQAFYIHHIIDALVERQPVHAEDVAQVVEKALTDSQDAWQMEHYAARLRVYYTPSDQTLVLGLLDALALSRTPLSFDAVFNDLKAQVVTEDIEYVRYLLTALQRDHYIQLHPDRTYGFRFPLIQRWWQYHRGLSS